MPGKVAQNIINCLTCIIVVLVFLFVSSGRACPLREQSFDTLRSAGTGLSGLLSGLPRGRLHVKKDASGIRLGCKIEFKDVAGSRDGDHAFEGLDIFLNIRAHGPLARKGQGFYWTLNAAFPRGQVLFFPWFFDLSRMKGSLRAEGRIDKGRLYIDRAILYGPFSLKVRGISLPCPRDGGFKKCMIGLLGSKWELRADLKRSYNLFVKDAFSDSFPVVSDFQPQGKMTVRGQGAKVSLRMEGKLLYKSMKFIDGLEVALYYPLTRHRCEKGSVSWNDIFLGVLLPKTIFKSPRSIAISERNLPVTLCSDKGEFGPLSLALGNGTISLEEAGFLFSRGTLVLRGIEIRALRVHRLLKDVPVEATIDGNLPLAMFVGDRLVFSGHLSVAVAGGMVEIKNIWMEPYAPVFRWGADISFRHLDLRVLSEKTPFGLVTGAVKGWVNGLVMSGGQPEAFNLLVKTDEKASRSKKISIKAIENLSILGGGGGSVSFLGRLFKEFSYSDIGISCKLKNDIFELHGLYRKGDREYLVKRGFWGGVNVINMNPRGRISFRDMLDRLKRIGESSQSKVEVK